MVARSRRGKGRLGLKGKSTNCKQLICGPLVWNGLSTVRSVGVALGTSALDWKNDAGYRNMIRCMGVPEYRFTLGVADQNMRERADKPELEHPRTPDDTISLWPLSHLTSYSRNTEQTSNPILRHSSTFWHFLPCSARLLVISNANQSLEVV